MLKICRINIFQDWPPLKEYVMSTWLNIDNYGRLLSDVDIEIYNSFEH